MGRDGNGRRAPVDTSDRLAPASVADMDDTLESIRATAECEDAALTAAAPTTSHCRNQGSSTAATAPQPLPATNARQLRRLLLLVDELLVRQPTADGDAPLSAHLAPLLPSAFSSVASLHKATLANLLATWTQRNAFPAQLLSTLSAICSSSSENRRCSQPPAVLAASRFPWNDAKHLFSRFQGQMDQLLSSYVTARESDFDALRARADCIEIENAALKAESLECQTQRSKEIASLTAKSENMRNQWEADKAQLKNGFVASGMGELQAQIEALKERLEDESRKRVKAEAEAVQSKDALVNFRKEFGEKITAATKNLNAHLEVESSQRAAAKSELLNLQQSSNELKRGWTTDTAKQLELQDSYAFLESKNMFLETEVTRLQTEVESRSAQCASLQERYEELFKRNRSKIETFEAEMKRLRGEAKEKADSSKSREVNHAAEMSILRAQLDSEKSRLALSSKVCTNCKGRPSRFHAPALPNSTTPSTTPPRMPKPPRTESVLLQPTARCQTTNPSNEPLIPQNPPQTPTTDAFDFDKDLLGEPAADPPSCSRPSTRLATGSLKRPVPPAIPKASTRHVAVVDKMPWIFVLQRQHPSFKIGSCSASRRVRKRASKFQEMHALISEKRVPFAVPWDLECTFLDWMEETVRGALKEMGKRQERDGANSQWLLEEEEQTEEDEEEEEASLLIPKRRRLDIEAEVRMLSEPGGSSAMEPHRVDPLQMGRSFERLGTLETAPSSAPTPTLDSVQVPGASQSYTDFALKPASLDPQGTIGQHFQDIIIDIMPAFPGLKSKKQGAVKKAVGRWLAIELGDERMEAVTVKTGEDDNDYYYFVPQALLGSFRDWAVHALADVFPNYVKS
ncbi:hypothetical protein BC830DRAFT_1167316 [Chytriomyces sp. MP71]|nr:hypothetical protein BC830DRAFT_1167316 [Chytriomyces sp. MP71]